MVDINDDDIPACERCGNGPVIIGDRYGNDGTVIGGRLYCTTCGWAVLDEIINRPCR